MTELLPEGKDLGVTPSEIKTIEAAAVGGSIAYISEAREPELFFYFLNGHNLSQIADLTDLPKSVIYLTYKHYGWERKVAGLVDSNDVIKERIKRLVTMATYKATERELKAIISGAKQGSPLVPRNISQLKALMDMLDESTGGGGQKTHNTNIQINQPISVNPDAPNAIDPPKDSDSTVIDAEVADSDTGYESSWDEETIKNRRAKWELLRKDMNERYKVKGGAKDE